MTWTARGGQTQSGKNDRATTYLLHVSAVQVLVQRQGEVKAETGPLEVRVPGLTPTR